jgi:hypothetical protein
LRKEKKEEKRARRIPQAQVFNIPQVFANVPRGITGA